MNNLIINLLIALISTVFMILVTEILFRFQFENEQINVKVAATGNQYRFYRFDPILGWSNSPNAQGVFRRKEFQYSVSINKYGMRNASINKNKNKDLKRIAVLGDSFIWGIGIDNNQRITELMQESIKNSEVLNFGVSGYASIQYYLMIDDIIKFKPDHVVLFVCMANDLTDNVNWKRYGYYGPYARIKNEDLKISGYPIPNVKKFGFKSKTAQIFGLKFLGHTIRKTTTYISDYSSSNIKVSVPFEEKIKVNNILIERIYERLSNNGIGLSIVIAPSKGDFNRLTVGSSLRSLSKKLNINYIEAIGVLEKKDFWVHDGHWGPSGHKKMAELVSNSLKNNL